MRTCWRCGRACWAAVPPLAARLLLAHPGTHRQRTLDRDEPPVDRSGAHRVCRLSLARRLSELFRRIDISLDTLPYNGAYDEPRLALDGCAAGDTDRRDRRRARGLGQLTNLGLPELAASTPESYVAIAAEVSPATSSVFRLCVIRCAVDGAIAHHGREAFYRECRGLGAIAGCGAIGARAEFVD